jgi:hypothetical protein
MCHFHLLQSVTSTLVYCSQGWTQPEWRFSSNFTQIVSPLPCPQHFTRGKWKLLLLTIVELVTTFNWNYFHLHWIGNCDSSAEQKILVMNETKWYEIWSKPKCFSYKSTFIIYRQTLLNVWTRVDLNFVLFARTKVNEFSEMLKKSISQLLINEVLAQLAFLD